MAFRILSLLALVALAVLAVMTERRAASRAAAVEADFPPIGQLLTVNGRQVHVWVSGQGPDLVLIHGASGNLRDFSQDFAARVSAQYRVIAFDRPGMGYTDTTDPAYGAAFARRVESPAEQAALLQAAAAALGADRPIVLGHSYGAAVALAWALNHPESVSGIVNLSGASMPWPGRLGALYQVNGTALGGAIFPPLIAAWLPKSRIEPIADSVVAPNPAPPGYARQIGAPLSIRTASLRSNARQVNSLRPHLVEMQARYPQIDVPVEILHGDLDTTVPIAIHSQPLSRLIPGSVLTVLPGVAHVPHHVDPQAVVDAIDRVARRAGLR